MQIVLKMMYGLGLGVFVSVLVLLFACSVDARKRYKLKPRATFEIKDESIEDLHTKVLSNSKTGKSALAIYS